MFKVIKKEGRARRGEFRCAHGGTVQTPVFMNVGTQAAIKGGVSRLRPEGCWAARSSCPTPITCTCAPATTWCGRWAACTGS